MSKTSDDSGKIRWWAWLLLLMFFVIVLWILAIIVLSRCFPDIVERGQFGDSFGMINALFSGLAFAGVICAIILQKKELELQRKELTGQKEQLAAQNQTLQKQNFESSFFQFLGLHNDIVNSMPYDNSCHGRECFGRMLGEFRNIFLQDEEIFWDEWHKDSPEDRRKFINHKYEKFFDQYQSQVGYYFRNLYNLVKFVDEKSDFPKDYKDKKPYTNLIRAQLSSDELGLLFYNCLSERGDKFEKLVVKYALLEDMDFKVLIYEEHKSLYAESAYGESKE